MRNEPKAVGVISTSRDQRRPVEVLALVGLLAVLLAPLIWFEYLPTEDGPAHSALATVVSSLLGSTNAAIEHFYVLDVFPNPNLLGTASLVGLQAFVGTMAAEKILMAGIVVGLAVSVHYALRGISRDATILGLLAVPLGLGLVSHFGFYNFMVGLILFVITIGFWHRNFGSIETVRARDVGALGLLLFLTYLGHLLPFVVAIFVIGIASLASALAEERGRDENSRRTVASEFWRTIRPVLLAALPSLFLLAIYVARSEGGGASGSPDLLRRLVRFGSFGELFVVFTRSESLFSILIAAATAVSFVVAMKQRRREGWKLTSSDGYLGAVVILAATFLLIPSAIAGGSAVPERMAMFTFIVALFWLAHFRYERWLRITIIAVSVVATIGLIGIRWPAYQGYDRDLDEYVSGTRQVAAGSAVLPLFLIEHDSGLGGATAAYKVRPLIEAGSYVTPLSAAVNLNHLHAEYTYSVAQFKPDLNARLLIGVPKGTAEPIYAVPPSVNIAGFEEQTGETVDYVLVWGRRYATAETLEDPAAIELLEVLERDYGIVFVSSDRGLMEVFARSR